MNSPAAIEPQLDIILKAIFQRKAISVTAVDVSDLTSYTDTIVIAEGNSNRQVTTLAEHVIKTLKGEKVTLLGKEGVREGEWALLDYGDVIVHIFDSESKSFFNLEGLWADAPKMDISAYKADQTGDA